LFGNPVSIVSEFTSADAEELLFGTTYFWRVRAMDDSGTSEWSEVFNYITFAQVKLDDPDDEGEDITPEIELEWKAKYGGTSLTGITFYDYEVAFDTTFNDIFLVGSKAYEATNDPVIKHTINLLLFDTTYYWHVRARHSVDQSMWSETWSFTTLDKCTNELPENDATGQMLNVTIGWDEIDGAFDYIYELCDDSSFSSPCIFFTDENTVTAQGLLFGMTYYWRVKATHTNDTTNWSDTWSFETMNTVTLVSPENESFVEDIFPTLTWEEVTGIGGFELMYDDDQDFTDPVLEMIDGEETSFKILFSLEEDTTYYWKMRAYENGDTTNWSEVWSFTIGEEIGINDLLSEHNVNIYPNPAKAELNIEVNALKQNTVEVSVLNLLGQTVIHEKFNLNQGINSNQIKLQDLQGGLYIIRLQSGEDTFMTKIVIEK